MLTGKYRTGTPSDSRAASEHFADFVRPFLDERSRKIVDAVVTAASGLGVAPLEVALAWVRDRPGVTSAVVGARTAAQLLGALATETLELPDEIVTALDEVSLPARGYPEHGWSQRPAPEPEESARGMRRRVGIITHSGRVRDLAHRLRAVGKPQSDPSRADRARRVRRWELWRVVRFVDGRCRVWLRRRRQRIQRITQAG